MRFSFVHNLGLDFDVRIRVDDIRFQVEPRSESVKATIADIAHSVGAPLSWVPPADLEALEDAGDSNRAHTQSLRVDGFNHVLEALSVVSSVVGIVFLFHDTDNEGNPFMIFMSGTPHHALTRHKSGLQPAMQVPLLGDYQRSNAALALAMLLELRSSQTLNCSCRNLLKHAETTASAGCADP